VSSTASQHSIIRAASASHNRRLADSVDDLRYLADPCEDSAAIAEQSRTIRFPRTAREALHKARTLTSHAMAGCNRMKKVLRNSFGFSEADTAFLDLFANPPSFENEALAVIRAGLDRGVSPKLIHRAALMLQSYELMYWDAMLEGLSD
jgi:hypothetical protein